MGIAHRSAAGWQRGKQPAIYPRIPLRSIRATQISSKIPCITLFIAAFLQEMADHPRYWHILCTSFEGNRYLKEKAMEALTGSRAKNCRPRVVPVGKPKFEHSEIARETEPDIVCHYGVVVHSASIAGIEIVEFEFLSDAA